MTITLTCECGKQHRLKDEMAGKRIRCQACDAIVTVPAAALIGNAATQSSGDFAAETLKADPSVAQTQVKRRTGPNIPGYKILKVIGRGGMGTVYQAQQVDLKRIVALKVANAGAHVDKKQLEQFRAEAETAATLTHANIAEIYDYGTADGIPYFSMEFVSGGSLADKISRRPLDSRLAAHIMKILAQAVQHAHNQKIIHRDLKPENVLLAADGTPKITDFGLARHFERVSDQEETQDAAGSPSYMAPEQLSGDHRKAGPSIDIYALGATLYALIVGKPPFEGKTVAEALLHVQTADPVPPIQRRRDLPSDLNTICLKCLEKDPEQRYASAADLAAELSRFLANEPIQARPISFSERMMRWCRRRPAVASLSAITALIAVIGIGVATWFSLRTQSAQQEIREIAASDGKPAGQSSAIGQETPAASREPKLAPPLEPAIDLTVERPRREQYAQQLALATTMLEDKPDLAVKVLDDEGLCPPDLRDFAWNYVRKLAEPLPAFDPSRVVECATLASSMRSLRALCFSGDGRSLTALGKSKFDTREAMEGISIWNVSLRRCGSAFAFRHPIASTFKFYALADEERVERIISTAFSTESDRVYCVTRLDDVEPVRVPFVEANVDEATLSAGQRLVQLKYELRRHNGERIQSESQIKFQSLRTAFINDRIPVPGPIASDGALVVEREQIEKRTHATSPLNVIDLKTGETKCQISGKGWIRCLAISPDARLLAIVRHNSDSVLDIYKLTDGAQHQEISAHGIRITAVAFTTDSTRLVSAADDGTVNTWDCATGRELAALKGHKGSVLAISISPDSSLLATGGADHTICLWDVATNELKSRLTGHAGPIHALAFSPNGVLLASGGEGDQIKLWAIASVDTDATIDVRFPDDDRPGSPEIRALATGIHSDVKGRRKHLEIASMVAAVFPETVSPTCKYCVDSFGVGRGDGFLDAATGVAIGSIRTTAGRFSADGRMFACNGNPVVLVDVPSGKTLAQFPSISQSKGSPSIVAFSAGDSRLILWNTEKKQLRFDVWDVNLRRQVFEERGDDDRASISENESLPPGHVCSEVFDLESAYNWNPSTVSPDGRLIAVPIPTRNSHDPELIATIIVWDAQADTRLHVIPCRDKYQKIQRVDILADSATLAVRTGFSSRSPRKAAQDAGFTDLGSKVRTWDLRSGLQRLELHNPHEHITAINLSTDGRTLATAGWDVGKAGDPIESKGTIYGDPESLARSGMKVGHTIVKYEPNYSIKLWDPITGHLRATIDPDTVDPIRTIHFTSDNGSLFTFAPGTFAARRRGVARLW